MDNAATARAEPARTDPAREDMVTASDLVRQFGTWRERAARAPVYVLHRGRPRLVLASMAVMDALCAPHDGEAAAETGRVAALLDGSPELIVLADAMLAITAASRSVRARFGEAAMPGAPLDALAPPHLAPLLAAAATRVAQSSQAETLDLPLAHDPARPVALAIEPYPGGIALFGRLPGDAEALAFARTERDALDGALAVSGATALAHVNARGYLDGDLGTLACLTGIAEAALGSVRFVTLFAVQSRVALGEAMEAVIADAAPRRLSADLLINRGAARTATIALAPVSRRGIATGVLALITAPAEPFDMLKSA